MWCRFVRKETMEYYFNTQLPGEEFGAVIDKTTQALSEEGFGILTQINIKDTLKNKLDVDFKKYTILGACNPQFAYQALQSEDKIGVFLPCNVIVSENEAGVVEVSAVDPVASMQAVQNDDLGEVATEVRTRLRRVIESLN